MLIDVADLNEVLERLNTHHFPNGKWSDLGLKLGLLKPTLDDIEAQYGNNISRCLRECLSKWLNKEVLVDKGGGGSRVNYKSLSEALSKIGEKFVDTNTFRKNGV